MRRSPVRCALRAATNCAILAGDLDAGLLSTPLETSTPKGRTRRDGAATLSALSPPARISCVRRASSRRRVAPVARAAACRCAGPRTARAGGRSPARRAPARSTGSSSSCARQLETARRSSTSVCSTSGWKIRRISSTPRLRRMPRHGDARDAARAPAPRAARRAPASRRRGDSREHEADRIDARSDAAATAASAWSCRRS